MSRIAIPLADEFEDSEFSVPYQRLVDAGHEVTVFGHEAGTVTGKQGKESVNVKWTAKELDYHDFDALVIPGGHSPDKLRMDEDIVNFVRDFTHSGKLVAAVCHGPQLLIKADAVAGKTLTSWPSIRKDLLNAQAHWVDREVVEDGNLLTSRNPGDLEAFSSAILEHL